MSKGNTPLKGLGRKRQNVVPITFVRKVKGQKEREKWSLRVIKSKLSTHEHTACQLMALPRVGLYTEPWTENQKMKTPIQTLQLNRLYDLSHIPYSLSHR